MKFPQAQKFHAHPCLHLFLIAIFGIAVYSLTFNSPFVFDDRTSIVDNPAIRDLSRFLGWEGYHHHPRRVLGYLSFALNYRFGGLHVAGYHVVNLAVHIATASLVYGLCLITFRTPRLETSRLAPRAHYIALFAALLFVAHPVQTEAVTYVTQRLASLATMFYLLALLMWVRGALSRGSLAGRSRPASPAYLAAAAVAGFAAMMTKEIAVTLPLAALLYAELFSARPRRTRLATLLPLVASVVVPFILWHITASGGRSLEIALEQARGGEEIGRWDYFVTQPRVIVTYLRLLLLPVGQNLDYDYPVHSSLLDPAAAGSLLLIAAIAGFAAWLYRRSSSRADPALRVVCFGIGFFLITLLVESSLIPLDDVIAEHRLYLPSAGAFPAFAVCGALIAARVGGPAMLLLAICTVFALGAATFRRNVAWLSPLALWRDTVAKSPDKARPRYNLGTVLNDAGAYGEAIAQFREAVRIRPGYADAWHNMGIAHAARGELNEAVADYRQALRLDPELAQAHNSLGAALVALGQLDEAIAEYQIALRIDPDFADARNNLGAAYGIRGMADAAIAELERAVRLDSGNARYRSNLAKAYELKGRGERRRVEEGGSEDHSE